MPASSAAILPGAILGILGGGQLGRMLALAAAALGYRVHVYSPAPGSPAGQVAEREVVGSYGDVAAIIAFAGAVDLLTFEFENISSAAVNAAAERTVVRPAAQVLATAQNRHAEKRFLTGAGFPVAAWAPVGDGAAPGTEPPAGIGFPAVVKTAGFGYDGKGQRRVRDAAEVAAAIQAAGGAPLILERVVPFERELSVIGARGPAGEYADFGPFENRHDRRHILDLTRAPAACSAAVRRRARELARAILETLDLVGLLCVELFQVGEELLVNELAPRPHNSGHLTIDACRTSQFEQHVRAVCGLPLGDPQQHAPAAMANLLGDLWPGAARPAWPRVLAMPGVKLHLYGKRDARAGRKMGHLTALAATAAAAVQRVTAARSLLAAAGGAAEESGN